jgi:hypothetical protein
VYVCTYTLTVQSVQSVQSVLPLSLCTIIQPLKLQPSKHFRGRVEKTNKSELWNSLTFRGLIYIFEVGRKTFRLSCQFSKPKSQNNLILKITDYGCPVRKSPSLHEQKSSPTPKFLGTAQAYFVCHISPNFQISLIYAFIGFCSPCLKSKNGLILFLRLEVDFFLALKPSPRCQ